MNRTRAPFDLVDAVARGEVARASEARRSYGEAVVAAARGASTPPTADEAERAAAAVVALGLSAQDFAADVDARRRAEALLQSDVLTAPQRQEIKRAMADADATAAEQMRTILHSLIDALPAGKIGVAAEILPGWIDGEECPQCHAFRQRLGEVARQQLDAHTAANTKLAIADAADRQIEAIRSSHQRAFAGWERLRQV